MTPAPERGTLVRAATCTDAGAIAHVQVDTWRATYGGIVPEAYLADLSYEARERQWVRILCGAGREVTDAAHRRATVFVAEDDAGEVAGFASGGPERTGDYPAYTGELYAIYVRRGCQHLGLGRRLVVEVARYLQRQGHRSMLVLVLAANEPARRFYERMGAAFVAEREAEIGGAVLPDAVYGWATLDGLTMA